MIQEKCGDCIWVAEIFGLVHCAHPEKEPKDRPEGESKMVRCELYETKDAFMTPENLTAQ